MDINQEIYKVLSSAGRDGLSAKKISLHVYNACNDLFRSANYDDVSNYVHRFLKRQSTHECSFVERTDKRGYYRLRELTNDLFPRWFDDENPAENVAETAEETARIDAPTLFTEDEMNSHDEIKTI